MIRRVKFVILMLAIASIFVVVSHSADKRGSVAGVVKDQSGEPAVGAFVRVKDADRHLSVTVVSQDLGRYTASNLLPGKYTVQGVGGGLESAAVAVEVDGSRDATVNLVLTAPIDYRGNVSIADMATLMPEGEGKDIIRGECTHCHLNGLEEIVVQRKNRDGWEEIINEMEKRSLEIQPKKRKVVIDYLAQNFGTDRAPFDQNKLPKEWARGAAAKSVTTEFFQPDGVSPHDMSVDSKGICWVGETTTGLLGRYDPQTETYTRIPIPGEKPWPQPIAVDSKDRVWFADGHGPVQSRLVRFDPKTGTFTSYPYPKTYELKNYSLQMIRFHPDGSVWGDMHSGRVLVRVDPETKEVSESKIPNSNILYGLAIDGSQNVWFSEQMIGKLARVDSHGDHFTEFDLPTEDSMPQRMAADAEGNIWVPEYRSSKIAMVDYRTTKITEYLTPTKNSGPYNIVVDKRRNLIWVDEMMAAQFARFDPRTKTFVEYPLPTRLGSVRSIELDPIHPNRIWFSGFQRSTVGYMDVLE